jgi:hypothetical protein
MLQCAKYEPLSIDQLLSNYECSSNERIWKVLNDESQISQQTDLRLAQALGLYREKSISTQEIVKRSTRRVELHVQAKDSSTGNVCPNIFNESL